MDVGADLVSDVCVLYKKDDAFISLFFVSPPKLSALQKSCQEQVKSHSGQNGERSWDRNLLQHEEEPTTGETDSVAL